MKEELVALMNHNRDIIEVGNKLKRLDSNTDFKSVILDGYMKQHVLSLTSKLTGIVEDDLKIHSQLAAVTHLANYLEAIHSGFELAVSQNSEIENNLQEDN